MSALKNRDFVVDGIKFHLNDNYTLREFAGKYNLLYWHEGMEKNVSIGCVDSKQEAIERAKDYVKYM